KRAVVFTGLAAEVGANRRKTKGEYLPDVTWWRSPYMASFSAGNFDFILITAHIRWDKEKNRIKPLKELAEWIHKRVNSENVLDKDIVLMGDFNIPEIDDELFKAITSKGLEIPDSLRGLHGTNLAKTEHYDQILHYRKYNTLKGVGGVVDFFQEDWRSLFPKKAFPKIKTLLDFTYQISDHLPLWIQVDTWTADEILDQYMGKKN
ncbi:MAG TPA: endonuclease, partial [Candidatus Nitrosotenuis sp.]|nr:endonuclease [Candidatus Nitrosotenuis sp.]